jgi:hypothetical protein
MPTFRPLRRAFKPLLAAALLLLFLATQAVALSHDLHHWLHSDLSSESHQCAAVVLQQGAVENPPPIAEPSRPGHYRDRLELPPTAPATVALPLSPPGRGPPAG